MFQDDAVLLPAAAGRTESVALRALAFGLLLVAAVMPPLLVEVPPLGDYPNHLARMWALAFLDQDPLLARYYAVEWHLVPNLVMDLMVPPLVPLVGVHWAGKLFIVATLVVQATGAQAVHYALYRRLSVGPLVAFLFLYNLCFLFGFFNFLFGIGAALWAVAAWITLRERAPVLRGAVSLAFVTVLFTSHLYAIGLYGLTLLCFEASLLWGRLWAQRAWADRRRLAADLLAFGVPFLAVPPLMLLSPTHDYVEATLWVGRAKLMAPDWLFGGYSPALEVAFGAAVAVGALAALRAGWVRLHPAGWLLAGTGALAFLAMPLVLFGSWFADSRLPVAVVLMLVGFARWRFPSAAARAGFVAAVAALALVRFAEVGAAFLRLEPALAELRRSFALVEPGSRILVVEADGSERRSWLRTVQFTDDRAVSLAFDQAVALAIMERSSLVSLAFAHPGKQVFVTRPEWHHLNGSFQMMRPTVSELAATLDTPPAELPPDAYWADWPANYDYLYVIFTGDGTPPALPGRLDLLHQGRHFQLYKVGG